jgi:hypothetical protein
MFHVEIAEGTQMLDRVCEICSERASSQLTVTEEALYKALDRRSARENKPIA